MNIFKVTVINLLDIIVLCEVLDIFQNCVLAGNTSGYTNARIHTCVFLLFFFFNITVIVALNKSIRQTVDPSCEHLCAPKQI